MNLPGPEQKVLYVGCFPLIRHKRGMESVVAGHFAAGRAEMICEREVPNVALRGLALSA